MDTAWRAWPVARSGAQCSPSAAWVYSACPVLRGPHTLPGGAAGPGPGPAPIRGLGHPLRDIPAFRGATLGGSLSPCLCLLRALPSAALWGSPSGSATSFSPASTDLLSRAPHPWLSLRGPALGLRVGWPSVTAFSPCPGEAAMATLQRRKQLSVERDGRVEAGDGLCPRAASAPRGQRARPQAQRQRCGRWGDWGGVCGPPHPPAAPPAATLGKFLWQTHSPRIGSYRTFLLATPQARQTTAAQPGPLPVPRGLTLLIPSSVCGEQGAEQVGPALDPEVLLHGARPRP